ncbi:MAG: EF-hand domain-containing protein [Thiohalobacteraceae bacterium]
MSDQTTHKPRNAAPFSLALGVAFAGSLAAGGAYAGDNPFAQNELSSGYMVAQMGEGKCGGMKEGKCGGMKMLDADGDGKVTREEFDKKHDAMFGKMDANSDGVIDADEMTKMREKMRSGKGGMEGKCGGMKGDKAKTSE